MYLTCNADQGNNTQCSMKSHEGHSGLGWQVGLNKQNKKDSIMSRQSSISEQN